MKNVEKSKSQLTQEIFYLESLVIEYKHHVANKYNDIEERKDDLKQLKRFQNLVVNLRYELLKKYGRRG